MQLSCQKVGAGVTETMLSETLEVVGIAKAVGRLFWLRKKTMNLCGYDSKEIEHGVGPGVMQLCCQG